MARRLHGVPRARPAGTATTSSPVFQLGMMFDALAEKMQDTLRRMRGAAKITEKNVEATLTDVRRALIDADVNVKVVDGLLQNIKSKALNMDVVQGVSPGQQFIKVVYDELVTILGGRREQPPPSTAGETPKTDGAAPPAALKPTPVFPRFDGRPTVVLMAGLQGSGKTTTAAKLARLCKEDKADPRKVLLVAADVYRPAAVDQLVTLGAQVGVDVYQPSQVPSSSADTAAATASALPVLQHGLQYARDHGYDVVIVDTAGRQVIDEEMMQEIRAMKQLAQPDETLLVVDAMIGQEAAQVTRAFHDAIGLSGAVLTKLDGDTRGGAALSIQQVSGAPIRFVGVGEQVSKLERFYPERAASRILGMGDVITLVERAQEAVDEKEAQNMARKMIDAKFDFDDFLKQTRFIKTMGSFSGILKLIPGMAGSVKEEQLREGERRLKVAESIINSMTRQERAQPDLLIDDATADSRMRRIARGSGRSVHEVKALLRDFRQMRNMMANMSQRFFGGSGGGGGAGAPGMPGMPSMPGMPGMGATAPGSGMPPFNPFAGAPSAGAATGNAGGDGSAAPSPSTGTDNNGGAASGASAAPAAGFGNRTMRRKAAKKKSGNGNDSKKRGFGRRK